MKLLAWVDKNEVPPESKYPKLADGSLIEIDQLAMPQIPGLQKPTTIHVAYKADYGPDWEKGIINIQPPRIKYAFQSRAAQVDKLGNEKVGIQNVEIRVPLATYTPWNIRKGYKGGGYEFINFRGTYLPLPKTEAEKAERNDPRPSIESLFKSKEDFLKKVEAAARNLVAEGFILEVDIERVKRRNEAFWDWLMK